MAGMAEQVFALPELLEIILIHLPQKDILLSQRINTRFRDTVCSSNRLQKALFFTPDLSFEARGIDDNRKYARCKPENNSLLLRAFPYRYPTIALVQPSANAGELTAGKAVQQASEQWSWDVYISFPADGAPSCSPAVHYPEASWRRMYLCQPPTTTLHLVRRWQKSSLPAIVREEGITMGDFVDEATKTQAGWHQSYISSDRDWHFEGNIRCSHLRADAPFKCADFSYIHWRALAKGVLQIMCDDWNPSQVVGVGAAVTADIAQI